MLAVEQTVAGHVVMGDSFESTLFKQTYQHVFEKDAAGQLKMGFNATLELKCSRELRLEGLLGCATNLNVRNQAVSDTEIGMAATCQWKFCSLTPRTTPCFLLEIATQVRAAVATLEKSLVRSRAKLWLFDLRTVAKTIVIISL